MLENSSSPPPSFPPIPIPHPPSQHLRSHPPESNSPVASDDQRNSLAHHLLIHPINFKPQPIPTLAISNLLGSPIPSHSQPNSLADPLFRSQRGSSSITASHTPESNCPPCNLSFCPSSLFDSRSDSTAPTSESDRSSRRVKKRQSQPIILEEPPDPDNKYDSPDAALDRLISLSTEMLAASTAALASTLTSRSSLSSLARIEHTLDHTIRSHERHLRRSLDTLEEQKLAIDGLDRELATWPCSILLEAPSRAHQEAADLTNTIVAAERARMRAGSHAQDLPLPSTCTIRQPRKAVPRPNTIFIHADGLPAHCETLDRVNKERPSPSRTHSSSNPLRHSISFATSLASVFGSRSAHLAPLTNASSLLSSFSAGSPNPSPPRSRASRMLHKRSSSCLIKHPGSESSPEQVATRSLEPGAPPNTHTPAVNVSESLEEGTSEVASKRVRSGHTPSPQSLLIRHSSHRHLNHHCDYGDPVNIAR